MGDDVPVEMTLRIHNAQIFPQTGYVFDCCC